MSPTEATPTNRMSGWKVDECLWNLIEFSRSHEVNEGIEGNIEIDTNDIVKDIHITDKND